MLSLQDICLKKTVDYFAAYYSVYSTMTKDQQLKSNFEPLRRVYSDLIAAEMYRKDSLREDYVDFVINNYLKNLDTRWLNNLSWDVIMKKMSEIGPVLEIVSIHENKMPWDKVVCHLPNLKSLIFREDCNDDFLYSVAKFCPTIELIDIQCSARVTDEGIKYLCCNERGTVSCPMLKQVFVYSTSVGDDGVKHLLKNLPSVEEISCERVSDVLYAIHSVNYLDKVKTYSLTNLEMELTRYSESEYIPMYDDILKICVTVCPRLKYLKCCVTKREHLKLCSQLSELESLDVEGLNETPVDINEYLKESGRKLKTLVICNVSMTVSVLVLNCPLLESLRMKDTTFLADNSDFKFVRHILEDISFTRLIFEDLETSRSVARLLSFYPNLKNIHFWQCGMYSSEIKTQIIKCCEQCELEDISFCFSVVEPQLLKNILSTCSSLESLNVLKCSLDGLNSEGHSEEMRIVSEQLESIASLLPNRPTITHYEY